MVCEECGRSNVVGCGVGLVCLHCGSTRIGIGEAPAVVDYRDSLTP